VKQTTFEEFVDLARRGTFVPVVKEIIADLLTPVSAFLKIAEHSDYAFLFESVEGGERVARYSFLGKDPVLVLRQRAGRTSIDRSGVTSDTDQPFVTELRRLMAEFQAPFVPDLPRFTGGAVGFIGYDASPVFEPVLTDAWTRAVWGTDGSADAAEDDAGFMLFDTVLAFDHVKHRILIIANARVTSNEDLRALYQFACAKIQFLERELERGLSQPEPQTQAPPVVRSNMSKETFEAGVRTIKEHIGAGDIYQAVLSQRFEADVTADPFTVYRALRHVNPSPYMYFMRMGGLAIVGSSPEMLVRVEGGRVETHPIAGTRPRGANEQDDLRLGEELKRNEKERAEHVMLVDLGRNDLGRVCEFGSVRVPQYMALERYSHVMHLVSTVDGRLAADRDRLDALVACFPAGTVSGAPKIRAMQIISALEPTRRDVYAGAVGYIDFAGNLDFCITIRTITIRNGRARVQAGAGIVADSNPAAEDEETRDKARAAVPRRAGRAPSGEAQRRDHARRHRGAEARADRHLARSGTAGGRRDHRPAHHALRAAPADSGRVPRSPGHRHGLRRGSGPRAAADARQDVVGAARRARGISRSLPAFHRRALPFARRGRAAPRLAGSGGADRRRDPDGRAPSNVPGARRAVPSRIRADR
jgi:anthranilate synthase component 1